MARHGSAMGSTSGMAQMSGDIRPVVSCRPRRGAATYGACSTTRARSSWQVSEVNFSDGGKPVQVGGPHQFSSAWKSAGRGEEWVYVDLGAPCTFDRVVLHWLARPSEGRCRSPTTRPLADRSRRCRRVRRRRRCASLRRPARGRYVRVLMTKAASAGRLRPDRDRGVRARRPRGRGRSLAPRHAQTAASISPAAPGACSATRWSRPTARRCRARASTTRAG